MMDRRRRWPLTALALLLASAPARGAQVAVAVSSNLYTPNTITIVEGDSLRFTNHGGLHNAQADDLSWRCAQGCSDAGGNGDASSSAWSFERFFNDPGTFRFHCEIHGGTGGLGMSGIIQVLPFQIFADDFETGDATGWDVVVP